MCFIVFAYDCHPDYLLILAANRDEYHSRPTAPAHFWKEAPDMLAGKDLEQSGTWLGVSRRGRFAAITNYRDPISHKPGAPSRGALVRDFLCSQSDSLTYIENLDKVREKYNGYNLLLLEGSSMWYCSNRAESYTKVCPEIHGLSNHLLNTPWPKIKRGKAALGRAILHSGRAIEDSLFELLSGREETKDGGFPQTGAMSPIFIKNEVYGTRSSTILLVGRSGQVKFQERSFGSDGRQTGTDVTYRFQTIF